MGNTIASRVSGLLLALFVVGQTPAWAATFTVNSTMDAVDASRGDGNCATATGVCTLRAAVQESNVLAGADTIILPAGTYTITIRPTNMMDSTGSFDIRDDLSIVGADAATTIVDGAGLDNVFTSAGTLKTINFANITIQNGAVSAFRMGGGISAQTNNSVTLTDVIVQNNHAGDGGGIYSRGNLTLVRSTVRGNTATRVGPDSPMYRQGGGIHHSVGTLTIRDSTVADNTAISAGGIFNAGTAFIEASTISGNLSLNTVLSNGDGGGGIVNGGVMSGVATAGSMSITNSTISGNRANGHHGGVYNLNGTVAFNNVTIANNIADADGDGFGNSGGLSQGNSGTATLRNSILAGNTAAGAAKDCFSMNAGALASGGYNLVGNQGADTDCAFVASQGDMVGTTASPLDPGLAPLAANGGRTFTHALTDASPAVDGGDAAGCSDGASALPVDQRGAPRAMSGGRGGVRCDIGAYELARPVAEAGADQRVQYDALVTLDGSGSSAWGGIASYTWTQVSGVPVALAGADSATPSFAAPTVGGVLTFRLTVADNNGATASDTVNVVVNTPPVADAGADSSVVAGSSVSLNGTTSVDPDGFIATYAWVQTGGESVAITNADSVMASFVAPAAGGTFTFSLTVTDNDGATHTDNVVVTVTVPAPNPDPSAGNKPPVANAGRDETVRPRSIVTLNGWRSYDPDGRIVSYQWVQTDGPRVNMVSPSWPFVMFVAPRTEGPLTFKLTVTDNKGATSTDTVRILVDDCQHRWFDWIFRNSRDCRR